MSKGVCVLNGERGVRGVIRLEKNQDNGSTRIYGEICGLTEGLHAFHVHEFGDLSEGCVTAGPHFNPFKMAHGGPEDEVRHVGDLGNIVADSNGVAKIDITDHRISIMGENSVIGRSMVVHQNADDLGKGGNEESLRTGNAGSRVACGVIGLSIR
uniref:Superoxide dismutase [Cu-Zn] n=1 Tax=Romanomermis culicivorax TaxID=13658 RepID=A0A915I5B5_ROMCU